MKKTIIDKLLEEFEEKKSPLEKLTYFIGKFSKSVRKKYWMNSGHEYLWGLIKFIQDDFSKTSSNDTLKQEDLEKFIKNNLKMDI